MPANNWNPISAYDDEFEYESTRDIYNLEKYRSITETPNKNITESKTVANNSSHDKNELAQMVRDLHLESDPYAILPSCDDILNISHPEEEIKLMLKRSNYYDYRNYQLSNETTRKEPEITNTIDFSGKIPVILDKRILQVQIKKSSE